MIASVGNLQVKYKRTMHVRNVSINNSRKRLTNNAEERREKAVWGYGRYRGSGSGLDGPVLEASTG